MKPVTLKNGNYDYMRTGLGMVIQTKFDIKISSTHNTVVYGTEFALHPSSLMLWLKF